jgi:hypothetical protein
VLALPQFMVTGIGIEFTVAAEKMLDIAFWRAMMFAP